MKKSRIYFLWISFLLIVVFVIQNLPGIPGFTDLFVLNDRANNWEVWRFVTSIFLHGSITHLLFNLVALLFFGFVLEKMVGGKRFLIIFLTSGILANIISINYYDSSLGASGAIYGILGALTIIRPLMMVWAFGAIMPMFLASIVWAVGDVLRILGLFGETNIGSIAHISGIVVGIVIGIYYRFGVKSEIKENKFKISFNEGDFKDWEESYLKD